MLLENIKEALRNIASNRMRSLLTMLGIIIGITAVITITTIGASIKSTLNATFNSITGKSLTLYVDAIYPEDVDWETWEYPEMDEGDTITQEMIDELVALYPDQVIGASINNWAGEGQIYESKEKYANVSVAGCTDEYLISNKKNIIRGRSITARDNREAKQVCVVSDRMVSYYFGSEDPIGQQIEYQGSDGTAATFVVVGVYEYEESLFDGIDTSVPEKDRSTYMYIPVSTANNLTKMDGISNIVSGYQNLALVLTPECDIDIAKWNVENYFNEKFAANEDWTVFVMDFSSDLEIIDTVINIVTVAISFIAAISLVVGGVGVMNIMLVSITERTREIGIRKALGAKNKTIHQQFLIESVVLCTIGGAIGIILGILLGILLGKVAMLFLNNYYEELTGIVVLNVHPSPIAIILSVGFSMLIGIFFGSYPAKKAAKMEVIDALRYE